MRPRLPLGCCWAMWVLLLTAICLVNRSFTEYWPASMKRSSRMLLGRDSAITAVLRVMTVPPGRSLHLGDPEARAGLGQVAGHGLFGWPWPFVEACSIWKKHWAVPHASQLAPSLAVLDQDYHRQVLPRPSQISLAKKHASRSRRRSSSRAWPR